MSYSRMSKRNRIAAGILGILMLFTVLFSAFYLAAEVAHDCTGEDCPICACIAQCEKAIRQIGNGAALWTIAFLPVVSMLVLAFLFVYEFSQETLVSEKVRLNN